MTGEAEYQLSKGQRDADGFENMHHGLRALRGGQCASA